jgi:hypothetical protein
LAYNRINPTNTAKNVDHVNVETIPKKLEVKNKIGNKSLKKLNNVFLIKILTESLYAIKTLSIIFE